VEGGAVTGLRAGDLLGLAVEEREVALEKEESEEEADAVEEEDCGATAERWLRLRLRWSMAVLLRGCGVLAVLGVVIVFGVLVLQSVPAVVAGVTS